MTKPIKPIGCGDNGCEFHRPRVGTNGGCRCLKHIRPTSERYEVTTKVRNLRKRLQQMEDSLHMALCIIENDASTHGDGDVRRRWVKEIEQESGMDRQRVMDRQDIFDEKGDA